MGLERGSEANQPLALAVVGGLTSSTVLSLFLVPVMFLVMARRSPADEHATYGLGHAQSTVGARA
jgi:Cu/Ag efflux pump CusA